MSNNLPLNRHLASFYDVRIGTVEDFGEMASIAERKGGDARRVARECQRIMPERYGCSLVATDQGSGRLVGFINVLILRPAFAKTLRQGDRPFRHLIQDEGLRFVANEEEVGLGNAGIGHDLFICHCYRDPDLSAKEDERIFALLISGLVERFVGNNIRAVLREVKGFEEAGLAEPGGYAILESFDDWHRRSGEPESTRPILVEGNRELALRRHNFHMLRLLDYQPPILRLPPAARDVIRCAYSGYSDAKIVKELGLTASSLNSRWTRIFDIVEAKLPALFEGGGQGRTRDRQPLLTYIRNHPEEMWPFEPRKE